MQLKLMTKTRTTAGFSCRAINITTPTSARPTILGNTIVGNAGGLYIDARTGDNTNQIFRHNLVAFNNVGLDVVFASTQFNALFADNVLFANAIQVRGINSPLGNRAVDPAFVNAGTGDYRLRQDSPLLDTPMSAITAALPWGDYDLAGNCRLADGDGDALAQFDVGAFEFEPRTFRNGFEDEAGLVCANGAAP